MMDCATSATSNIERIEKDPTPGEAQYARSQVTPSKKQPETKQAQISSDSKLGNEVIDHHAQSEVSYQTKVEESRYNAMIATFILFPNIPIELRLKIWKLSTTG